MLLCIINFFFKPINMLRGTVIKKDRATWNQRPTLQGQINALKAQVNKTKPETQFFRAYGSHTSTGTGAIDVVHHLITSSLIGNASFRDWITGDQWRNLFLKFRIHSVPNNTMFRLVLYVPKDPGVTFSPSIHQYALIPDPSSYWILYDRTFTDKDVNADNHMQTQVSLKGLKTVYDSNAAATRKGDVIATIISTSTNGGVLSYHYAYELGFSNL